ncbi:MAG: peptide chain release factor N(5)-glutamine methyltransferase [Dehalococcoidia bacterium]|nr:peptide chain release factor N(5)-glutamine methyltransferase [Dehalococcoidia bacterium]MDW8119161.1 peptide chain release factor N(5)-glutamine methyltransferase [Chloroflexota bacterium]
MPYTTVRQAWAHLRRALEDIGSPDAPREAELLLTASLGWDTARLLAHPDAWVPPEVRERLFAWLARRWAREPVPYILGEWEFYGQRLEVSPAVMVPRPETEALVESALAWAGKHFPNGRGLRVADIGTGSGAIVIALALHLRHAVFYGVDASAPALEVARRNARRWGVEERIVFVHGDLAQPLPCPVHLITANLPYIPSPRLAHLQPEVARWEPRMALDGGPDGTALQRRLLTLVQEKLCSPGLLLLEMDPEQAFLLQEEAQRYLPGAMIAFDTDAAGTCRVLRVERGS